MVLRWSSFPPGKYRMGDIQGEGGNDEQPVHEVNIRKPFAVSRYEITSDQYDEFAKATGHGLPEDEGFGRGRRPVIRVSWNEAVDYTAWLSQQTRKRYRLPTEAEWEYAARAGTETAYWWGNEMKAGFANCMSCGTRRDRRQTEPVGSFKPNPFGLYDTAATYGNGYRIAGTKITTARLQMDQLGNKITMATATHVCTAAVLFGALTKEMYVHRLETGTARVRGLAT